MKVDDIGLPLTGDNLLQAMNKDTKRTTIVESLLYEKTTLMIAAEPGAGKSTISTQVAVELAAGLPVFGFLQVTQPTKIFYIQSERSIIELLERLAIIKHTYPIIKENIVITDEYQRFNLLNMEHAALFIKCLKRDLKGAKVIFVDPIYSTVAGGLKEDKPASAFAKIMSIIQKEFDCCLWYNHHTVKPQYDGGGKIERDDPFYGSQWLKAHVTGSLYMKKTEKGVVLHCKKDNYSLLSPKLQLEYNPETELSHLEFEEMPAITRVRNFLQICQASERMFSFNDIQEHTKLCTRSIRAVLMHSSIRDCIKVVSSKRNRNLYRVSGTL